MGALFSADETTDTDNTGNSNVNNVIISKPVELDHLDLVICIYIITIILLAQFIITVYREHQKRLKKKYRATHTQMQNTRAP